MPTEVRRDVVRIGLDFRPIPVDLGDGIEWEFTSDPSPEQWELVMNALQEFTKFGSEDFGGTEVKVALDRLTVAMSELIVNEEQRPQWVAKRYGLGPQQAISQALMEQWTGLPTTQPEPSGKGSVTTG